VFLDILALFVELIPLFYSLVLCDAEYKNLPECKHRFVFSVLSSVKKEGNPYYVSSIVYGLAKTDMSWDDLDDELCFLMEETIGAVRGSGDLKVGWHDSSLLFCLPIVISRSRNSCTS
jgi:hypothetical protein